jgi:hypothetical protein
LAHIEALQELERWSAVLVQCHDLAINYRILDVQRGDRN